MTRIGPQQIPQGRNFGHRYFAPAPHTTPTNPQFGGGSYRNNVTPTAPRFTRQPAAPAYSPQRPVQRAAPVFYQPQARQPIQRVTYEDAPRYAAPVSPVWRAARDGAVAGGLAFALTRWMQKRRAARQPAVALVQPVAGWDLAPGVSVQDASDCVVNALKGSVTNTGVTIADVILDMSTACTPRPGFAVMCVDAILVAAADGSTARARLTVTNNEVGPGVVVRYVSL